ncbi:sugar kinase [Oleiagrimonas sp. C23AA]|uniref:sugar kinase n=1 Tax=Oleiagrimonas sp. C23AA TaxID=2719047 RepID=UPI001423280D|nr:sugar kinase [Oleiagrimonas sp. C23AA]NII09369.1 sugar kinase [Oleiagrimonas sp. C23AA]
MSRTSHADRRPRRVVCFGELLMRLSAPGRECLLQSPRLDVQFGGAEANVAASLAYLGHEAVMVSTLPDNALGATCAGELRRHGVDTCAVRTDEGRMGLYFLQPGAMQRPAEVLYDRADSAFACAAADRYDWPVLLEGADWLHVSGITPALGPAPAEAARQAMRAARRAGMGVSFDCNFRSKLWGDRLHEAPAVLRALVAEATWLFGNDRDIALLLGKHFAHDSAMARFQAASELALQAWPQLAGMASTERTHQSVEVQQLRGLMATREGVLQTRAFELAGIVDRIGAGDAFAAGLLHALWGGWERRDALDFAVAAACLKHSIPGDVNRVGEAAIRALLDDDSLEVKR